MTTAQKQMSCNNIELLHTLLWQLRICLLFLPPFLLFACFCKLLLLRLLCLLLLCPLKHRLPLFAQAMISRNDQHFSLALSPPPAAPSLASCLLSLWRQHFKFIYFAQTKRVEKCKKKMKKRAKNVLKRKLKHHLRQPRTLDVALVVALRCAAAFIITPVSFLAVAPLLLLLMLLPCLCSHCWLAALLIYCILFSRCIFSAFSALVLRFCFVASCHSISLALESRAGEMMY